MQDLTQAQWAKKLAGDPNAVILDVRTAQELEQGHIPNARHLDVYDTAGFMGAVKTLDTSKNYYVYCHSGGRSKQACMILGSQGIAHAYNLLGGFSEWKGETETH
ncbi:MAG: rhodanese-like domain-containing protein [Marinirhabdus sp.]